MPRCAIASSPRRAYQLVLVALVVAFLTSCTAGPSDRPAVVENDNPAPAPEPNQQPVPLPPLEEPQASAISWRDCDGATRARLDPPVSEAPRFSCANVVTTLDAPDLPNRGSTRVALLKAGSGPIPLVVVNDIGGEPGTLFAARLSASLPAELLQRFSLIGVDRRGTGQSDPVRCIPAGTRAQLVGEDPAGDDIEPLLGAARKAGQQCTIELENQQGALDSWRAAGDLNEIRQRLGLSRLHALGHGEGSKVLGAYATRFTDQVGRFVLDGMPDPSSDETSVLDGVAAGLESTLDAFAADCANRGCPLGDHARGAITALTEQLRTAPLIEQTATIGPSLALRAVRSGLAQRQRWPELAEAIAAARGGNGAQLARFTDPLVRGDRQQPARLDGFVATMCNDTATRLAPDRIREVGQQLHDKYPTFGKLVAQRLAWCGPWPVRRESMPTTDSPDAPPILVASTAADPVTPEKGTINATAQLPTAVRVGWQGAGHGAVGNSSCATDAVHAFLVDGKVPRDGTLCPP